MNTKLKIPVSDRTGGLRWQCIVNCHLVWFIGAFSQNLWKFLHRSTSHILWLFCV